LVFKVFSRSLFPLFLTSVLVFDKDQTNQVWFDHLVKKQKSAERTSCFVVSIGRFSQQLTTFFRELTMTNKRRSWVKAERLKKLAKLHVHVKAKKD
jgi:hypothetical protein